MEEATPAVEEYADRIVVSEPVQPESESVSVSGEDGIKSWYENDLFSFAEPEEIITMKDFLNLSSDDVLSEENVGFMQSLHRMSKESDKPLYSFLLEISSKVGSPIAVDFLGNLKKYVMVLEKEHQLWNDFAEVQQEKQLYSS